MLSLSKHNWLSGTLELSSKVRYGLTSRGIPRFRFVPYDRRFAPLAVGCSSRDLFYNVHAIVEPAPDGKTGTLVQNLGRPTLDTELEVLTATYAFDSQKDLRKFPSYTLHVPDCQGRTLLPPASTFHIDPPGCRDVDDSITIVPKEETPGTYEVSINIADVDAWVPSFSPLNAFARHRATSFYTPTGEVRVPMFPPDISEEGASLLPSSQPKPTVSLTILWTPGAMPEHRWFSLTATQTSKTYTYESAEDALRTSDSNITLLHKFVNDLDPSVKEDSHKWISTLMIYYNCVVARILREQKIGILRRSVSSPSKKETLASIQPLLADYPELKFLAFDSAEFCNADDKDVSHTGLNQEAYCYATSPLRRYADLVNQRILKDVLCGIIPQLDEPTLVEDLNRRQKQAKAFSKDLFYATALSTHSAGGVDGVVLCHSEKGLRIYVPSWSRIIRVRSLLASPPAPGSKVKISWYEEKAKVGWKEKIVFQIVSQTPSE